MPHSNILALMDIRRLVPPGVAEKLATFYKTQAASPWERASGRCGGRAGSVACSHTHTTCDASGGRTVGRSSRRSDARPLWRLLGRSGARSRVESTRSSSGWEAAGSRGLCATSLASHFGATAAQFLGRPADVCRTRARCARHRPEIPQTPDDLVRIQVTCVITWDKFGHHWRIKSSDSAQIRLISTHAWSSSTNFDLVRPRVDQKWPTLVQLHLESTKVGPQCEPNSGHLVWRSDDHLGTLIALPWATSQAAATSQGRRRSLGLGCGDH